MRKSEFDNLTDKRFLEVDPSDVGRSIFNGASSRLEVTSNSSINKTSSEISDNEKKVFDLDPEQFIISPEISKIAVGDSIPMSALAVPTENCRIPNDPNVVWESSDWNVAYFTDGNVLNAFGIGSATITATDTENPGNAPVSCDIEVVSLEDLKGGSDEPVNPDPEPEPEPEEPVVEKPEETENTPAQNEVANDIASAMVDTSEGTKAYSAEVESINNITVPSEAGRSATITGAVQDGATITNESTGKYITITGTQEEPVDVSVITEGGAVYLRGEYNDVYLEGKSLKVSSSTYPNIHGTVSVADTDQPVDIALNFVGDDCGVVYLGDSDLTISDGNNNDLGSPTIYAPNATVKMGGKYGDVTATVGEDTLILNNGFHASKLTVLKGNVFVNGLDIADFADEVDLHEGCTITYAEYHVSQSSNSKLMGSSPANGKIILDTDIELTKGRAYSALASGKEIVDLNGHTWKCGDTRATDSNLGSYYLRGSRSNVTLMDSVGGGVFENNHADYLIFANGMDVEVNILSGEYRGYTHTLYSLLGTINVYGGTFKLLDAATAERDANGHLKFLLNCYDANYTAGTAKINVYGGKFYEFNPAVTYGEPGGPVSYVADGYHVVESEEDGVAVFEVLPNE